MIKSSGITKIYSWDWARAIQTDTVFKVCCLLDY